MSESEASSEGYLSSLSLRLKFSARECASLAISRPEFGAAREVKRYRATTTDCGDRDVCTQHVKVVCVYVKRV